MSYEILASFYDSLMEDVPYEQWETFFEDMITQFHVTDGEGVRRVLDVGCGTGVFLEYLCEKKYESVVGLDLSEEMLAIAHGRLEERWFRPLLIQESMVEFDLGQTFDAVTIFIDGLNYVIEEEDVRKTIANVGRHLESGGLFLFDVHTPYKMESEFGNETYSMVEDDYVVLWNTFTDEDEPLTVTHELTFFTESEGSGLYERSFEHHKQKTHPIQTYLAWLEEYGFEVCSVLGEDLSAELTETCTRAFICARKK